MYLLGRAEDSAPRLMVVSDGVMRRKAVLREIWMSHAVADDRCIYYVRSEWGGASHFSAITPPAG